ncbi:uncharacterized protein LOC129296172 [Prosopis cineraria]|uniref:uncharacterized protein LOC129296172 n=1 Tax=Prosopis cineraria TaxID=364024 RepID=UPI00241018E1|nr:uncharacterized protein LOC129296172 [Prosopis cineraria]
MKVNASKIKMFFSNNIHNCKREELSSFLGFSRTDDLGKYLSVNLHHKRVTKETFGEVVDKGIWHMVEEGIKMAGNNDIRWKWEHAAQEVMELINGGDFNLQQDRLPLEEIISMLQQEWKYLEGSRETTSYRPQLVAMGPIHSGTESELQIMEETKWRYMHHLLSRPTGNLQCKTLRSCCELLIGFDSIIRASYADGETMELGAEELARIMLLDGCFLLELLLKLQENVITDPPLRHNQSDPSLDFTDDKKKILRVLTDLTLLENQIPLLQKKNFLLKNLPSHTLNARLPTVTG